MNKALIWDLDGTLTDSYPRMVDALFHAACDYGIDTTKCDIYRYITQYSIREWVRCYTEDSSNIMDRYHHYLNYSSIEVPLIEGVDKTLTWAKKKGYYQFIYTHSSNVIIDRLKNLGIHDFFDEVITIDSGFKPKPSNDVYRYLKDKYLIDKGYVIGDRTLDMDFAFNSGIQGILYLPNNSYVYPNGHQDYIIRFIDHLIDLLGD